MFWNPWKSQHLNQVMLCVVASYIFIEQLTDWKGEWNPRESLQSLTVMLALDSSSWGNTWKDVYIGGPWPDSEFSPSVTRAYQYAFQTAVFLGFAALRFHVSFPDNHQSKFQWNSKWHLENTMLLFSLKKKKKSKLFPSQSENKKLYFGLKIKWKC